MPYLTTPEELLPYVTDHSEMVEKVVERIQTGEKYPVWRCHVNCLRHTSRRLVCPMRQAPTKLRAFERGTVSLTFWKSSVVGC